LTGQISGTPDFFTDGLSTNMPAPGLGGAGSRRRAAGAILANPDE